MPHLGEYRSTPEQVFKFTLMAFDRNCQQHILHRFEAEDMRCVIDGKNAQINALEEKVRQPEAQT